MAARIRRNPRLGLAANFVPRLRSNLRLHFRTLRLHRRSREGIPPRHVPVCSWSKSRCHRPPHRRLARQNRRSQRRFRSRQVVRSRRFRFQRIELPLRFFLFSIAPCNFAERTSRLPRIGVQTRGRIFRRRAIIFLRALFSPRFDACLVRRRQDLRPRKVVVRVNVRLRFLAFLFLRAFPPRGGRHVLRRAGLRLRDHRAAGQARKKQDAAENRSAGRQDFRNRAAPAQTAPQANKTRLGGRGAVEVSQEHRQPTTGGHRLRRVYPIPAPRDSTFSLVPWA